MSKAAFLRVIKDFNVAEDCNDSNDYLVKIKVDSCAICGSDIRIFNYGNKRISYPAIIGHEVSGTVVESKNQNYQIGDKISLGADIPCGECPNVKMKNPISANKIWQLDINLKEVSQIPKFK